MHLAMFTNDDSIDYKTPLKEQAWNYAIIEELLSIEKNNILKLTKLSVGKKSLLWDKCSIHPEERYSSTRQDWMQNVSCKNNGLIMMNLSPEAKHDNIRLKIVLAYNKGWSIFHLDVKLAFLNDPLEQEVFIAYLLGFEAKGKKDILYKLHKGLYGLKQAPKGPGTKWYTR